MPIFNRTEEEQKMLDQIENIRGVLQRQISGFSDIRRSKEYWRSILDNFPAEAIAEALSSELNHFNYKEVSRITCCCKR